MAAEIHVGDVGTTFVITMKDEEGDVINLTTATLTKIIFRKPNGDVVEQDAEVVSAVNGQMRYVTEIDDLDVAGSWKIQGYIEMPAGSWHSNIEKFRLYPNLGD